MTRAEFFASFSAPQSDKVHCAVHNLDTTVCNDSGDEGNLSRINIVTWVRQGHVQNRNFLRKKRHRREHFNPYNFT